MIVRNYFDLFRIDDIALLSREQKTIIFNSLKFTPNSLYLFYGSPGCGKTTFARIFAKSLGANSMSPDIYNLINNECNYVFEYNCSHMSIDDIRNVFNSHIYNLKAKYRMIILDEVHALSKAAQTVILNATEEAKDDLKIIIVTTDIHLLIDAIISRSIKIYIPFANKMQKCNFANYIVNHYNKNKDLIGNYGHIISEDDKNNFVDMISDTNNISFRDIITYFITYFMLSNNIQDNIFLSKKAAKMIFDYNTSLDEKIKIINTINNHKDIVNEILDLLSSDYELSNKFGELSIRLLGKITNNNFLIIYTNLIHSMLCF